MVMLTLFSLAELLKNDNKTNKIKLRNVQRLYVYMCIYWRLKFGDRWLISYVAELDDLVVFADDEAQYALKCIQSEFQK